MMVFAHLFLVSLSKENIETARVNKIAITCVKAKETLVSVEDNKINGVLKRDVSYMATSTTNF